MGEQFLSFRDVGKLEWLPRRRNNSRPVASTVWRWFKIGVNGVRLQTIQIGRSLFTKEEWVKEFFEDSAAAKNNPIQPPIQTPTRRKRAAARAQQRLADFGFDGPLQTATPESPVEDRQSAPQSQSDEIQLQPSMREGERGVGKTVRRDRAQ
jgi:hypothetical protein